MKSVDCISFLLYIVSFMSMGIYVLELYVFDFLVFTNMYISNSDIGPYANLLPEVVKGTLIGSVDWIILTSNFLRIVYITIPSLIIIFFLKIKASYITRIVFFGIYCFAMAISFIIEGIKLVFYIFAILYCDKHWFCMSLDTTMPIGTYSTQIKVLIACNISWIALIFFFFLSIFVLFKVTEIKQKAGRSNETTCLDFTIYAQSFLMMIVYIAQLYLFRYLIFTNKYIQPNQITQYNTKLSPSEKANTLVGSFSWFILTIDYWRIIYILIPPMIILLYAKSKATGTAKAIAIAYILIDLLFAGVVEVFKFGYYFWAFVNCSKYWNCMSYDNSLPNGTPTLVFLLMWICNGLWICGIITYALQILTLRNSISIDLYYDYAFDRDPDSDPKFITSNFIKIPPIIEKIIINK